MENWFLNHPKLQQMQSYGLDNPSQMYAALHAYLDLTEVKLWSEVRVHPCPSLKAAYFTARENEASSSHLVLPLPSSHTLSMQRFSEYFETLRDCERQRQSSCPEPGRLTVALVDTDSTILYYHVWDGIHPINLPN